MYELRSDYLSNQKVLIAKDRNGRPNFFEHTTNKADNNADCPFCAHNAHMVQGILLSEASGRIRVAPNKYPAVTGGFGIHDVVIDTNIHDEKFRNFSNENMVLLLKIFNKRMIQIRENPNLKYVQIFKNDGPKSGASIAHSHWQVIALPFVPDRQKNMDENFLKYYLETSKHYISSIAANNQLVVFENKTAFAYIPYASSFGYGVNIAPKRCVSAYGGLSDKELADIADCMKAVLSALNTISEDVSYNITFQMPPFINKGYFHFFMEIIPRLGTFAGFELGSGVYINAQYPEDTAALLLGIIRKGD